MVSRGVSVLSSAIKLRERTAHTLSRASTITRKMVGWLRFRLKHGEIGIYISGIGFLDAVEPKIMRLCSRFHRFLPTSSTIYSISNFRLSIVLLLQRFCEKFRTFLLTEFILIGHFLQNYYIILTALLKHSTPSANRQ